MLILSALLDFMISNFIRPVSSFVRVTIISNPLCWFLSIFNCCLPWATYIRPYVIWIFENLHFQIFAIFFFIFVNMEPYGSKRSKTYLLLQIAFELLQTFPKFSSQWSSHKYYLGIFEIFNMFFFYYFVVLFVCFFVVFFCLFFLENLKFPYISYGETKNCYYLENGPS